MQACFIQTTVFIVAVDGRINSDQSIFSQVQGDSWRFAPISLWRTVRGFAGETAVMVVCMSRRKVVSSFRLSARSKPLFFRYNLPIFSPNDGLRRANRNIFTTALTCVSVIAAPLKYERMFPHIWTNTGVQRIMYTVLKTPRRKVVLSGYRCYSGGSEDLLQACRAG